MNKDTTSASTVEDSVARDRHGQGLPCAFCDGRVANVEHSDVDHRHVIVNGVVVCRRCLSIVERINAVTEQHPKELR